MSKKALQDHAEELLDAIVSDMKSSQTGNEQSRKSKGRKSEGVLTGVGRKHAIDRLEGGLELGQLVSEYRALRASVLRLWENTESDKKGEMAGPSRWPRLGKKVPPSRCSYLGALPGNLRRSTGPDLTRRAHGPLRFCEGGHSQPKALAHPSGG